MKHSSIYGRTILAVGAAVALTTTVLPAEAAPKATVAVLRDTNGNPAGIVRFTFGSRTTIVDVRVGIGHEFSGFHGFHVHAVGKCEKDAVDAAGKPTPFFTAGGHLNPSAATHGRHDGDMPPLLVDRDGRQHMTFRTAHLKRAVVFDADGSAVIVHTAPDNLGNIPTRYSSATGPGPDTATLATGDSGGRLLCGVVK